VPDSKKKAEVIGDALLASAQLEREQAAERNTHPLVRIYPSLKQVPPLERYAVLGEAREYAAGYLTSRLLLAAMSIALAVIVALALTGHAKAALVAACVTLSIVIGRQFVELILMRRYLRQRVINFSSARS